MIYNLFMSEKTKYRILIMYVGAMVIWQHISKIIIVEIENKPYFIRLVLN